MVTGQPGLQGEEGASESILPPSQHGSRSVGPAVGRCRDPCWAPRGPAPFLARQPGRQSSSSRQPSPWSRAHQQERGSWGSSSLGHRKGGPMTLSQSCPFRGGGSREAKLVASPPTCLREERGLESASSQPWGAKSHGSSALPRLVVPETALPASTLARQERIWGPAHPTGYHHGWCQQAPPTRGQGCPVGREMQSREPWLLHEDPGSELSS